jgi:superfamily I DNA/RNA helicase
LNSIFLNKVGNRKAADLEEEILELCILQHTVERYRALYKNSKLTQLELEKKIQEKMESDPYLNSLWLSWGYAGTCHKAQGSEWPHVVFDLGNSEWAGSAFAYTGLTRAQETLTILNLDNYRGSLQGEDLNLIGLDDIEKSISKDNLAETWMDKSKKDITSEDLTHVDKKADNPMDRLKKWMKNK